MIKNGKMINLDKLTLRQKLFRKYWWFTTIWGRGNQYFILPIKWITIYGVITTWLKLYFGFTNQLYLIVGAIGLGLIIYFTGYLDVKHHIFHEENSFNNQFNPEITHLVKKVGGEVKK